MYFSPANMRPRTPHALRTSCLRSGIFLLFVSLSLFLSFLRERSFSLAASLARYDEFHLRARLRFSEPGKVVGPRARPSRSPLENHLARSLLIRFAFDRLSSPGGRAHRSAPLMKRI